MICETRGALLNGHDGVTGIRETVGAISCDVVGALFNNLVELCNGTLVIAGTDTTSIAKRFRESS